MAEQEQESNFSFSPNSVNNADVRLEDVHKLENDNVVEVESMVESSSGRGRGRGDARGVEQKGGNDSGGVAEGSTSAQSSSGVLISDVWNHFKRYKDADGEYQAVCNYCSKVLTRHYSSGTTHLKNHFTSCLRKNFKDVGQMPLAKNNDRTVIVESCSEVKCDMVDDHFTRAYIFICWISRVSWFDEVGLTIT